MAADRKPDRRRDDLYACFSAASGAEKVLHEVEASNRGLESQTTSSIHQRSCRNCQLQNPQHTDSTRRWRLSRQISTRKWRCFLRLAPDCRTPYPVPAEGSCGRCSKRSACRFQVPRPQSQALRGSPIAERIGEIHHCPTTSAVLYEQSSASRPYHHNANIIRESMS